MRDKHEVFTRIKRNQWNNSHIICTIMVQNIYNPASNQAHNHFYVTNQGHCPLLFYLKQV